MFAQNIRYAQDYWDLLQGKFMLLEHIDVRIPQRYGITILPTDEVYDFIRRCCPYE